MYLVNGIMGREKTLPCPSDSDCHRGAPTMPLVGPHNTTPDWPTNHTSHPGLSLTQGGVYKFHQF